MAKSGTPRHSRPAQKPVTINLDAADVKRLDDAPKGEQEQSKALPAAEPVGDFSRKSEPASVNSATTSASQASSRSASSDKPPFTAGVKSDAQTRSNASPTAASAAAGRANASSGLTPLWYGLTGGIVALAGFMALQWANVIPSPGAQVTAAQLTRLEQEISALRAAPPPAPFDDSSKAQLAQLQDNVKAAEIKSEAVAGSLAEMQKQLDGLPAASAASNGDENAGLGERLSALESKLSQAEDQASQAAAHVDGNSNIISSLENKLSTLQERVASVANQPDASLLIAANALKSAVDRGGSFKGELNTYAAIAPGDAGLDALRPFAERGVPTLADLNAWFGGVANRVVATENQLPADASFWDHLVASAKGLVSVRPVAGNIEGNGAGPITARMEAALQAGDLDRALTEWDQLSADAKAVSQEFVAQIKARRDADGLLQRLVAESLKSKASTGSPASGGN